MKKFFKSAQKLTHKQYREIAAFCGGVALLLLIAGFVAQGGMTNINQLLAINHVTPDTQTACGFFSACTVPVYIYSFTATPSPVVSGAYTSLNWSTYDADDCMLSNNSCVPGAAAYYDQVCTSYSYDKYGSATCATSVNGTYHPATASYNCGVNIPTNWWGSQQEDLQGGSGPYSIGPITLPTTFSLQCFNRGSASNGVSSVVNLTVNPACPVGYTGTPPSCVAPAPIPVVTIDAGAGPGVARTVTVGTPVTITATFTPGSGDTISKTSLVDSSSAVLPGVSTAVPPTTKSYVFTPAAPGSFVFYPSAQTGSYPAWNNYGKSVTITAAAVPPSDICSDISGNQTTLPPGCTGPVPTPTGSCVPSGDTYNGSACIPIPDACSNIPGTQATPPANGYASGGVCSCNIGYGLSGASCVATDLCSNIAGAQTTQPADSTQNSDGTCSCNTGFVLSSGSCIAAGVISSLTVSPSRVLKGNPVTVTWVTAHMDSCALTALSSSGSRNLSSSLNLSISPTVDSKTIYTLTCTDPSGASYSASATVNLIPQTIEQ